MNQPKNPLLTKNSALSPLVVVLLLIGIQALFFALYFYLGSQNKVRIESAELTLLLSFSAIASTMVVIVGVVRTRWMQRENSVRQRLIAVIEATPDPSAVRDVKGRYVMWNKAAEEYHGIQSQHVVGKTPFDLFPPDMATTLLELDAQCHASGSTVVKRLELPAIYGKSKRVAIMRVAPVRSATDASIRGVVTIVHDVTESEREAAALRHMSTQLKMALDRSGFGSWIVNIENNALVFSEQYQALVRYQGKQFNADFDFPARVHPDDHDRVMAAASLAIQKDVAFDEVFRLRCFDEQYRVFRSSGESALDASGKRYFAGLFCPQDRSAD
jgi:PAS domain S-box-containing protein